jgi:CubicO group peptidase (beta-lactamase class C family)
VIALLDGDAVILADYKAPADSDSIFFSFSMGKTVTSVAVGQALCAGRLKLGTKADDVLPELKGTALGSASVKDLLMMASGAAEPFADSSIWTPEQFARWGRGDLTIVESVTQDRVTQAARGVFSPYKPGEHFSYKSTDPMVLGLMVTRATGMSYARWVQAMIFERMGAAKTGLIVQDKKQDGATDGGIRLRLEDWIRFAQWVKRSAKEDSCLGNYSRSAMSTQITNSGTPATRKFGKLFGGYGYLIWTENTIAPGTSWASGWGGQRISWNPQNDRMVVAFSNQEDWMPELYALAKEWSALKSAAILSSDIKNGAPSPKLGSASTGQTSSRTLEQELEITDQEGEAMENAFKGGSKGK